MSDRSQYEGFLGRAALGFLGAGYEPLLLASRQPLDPIEGWDQVMLANEPGSQSLIAFTYLEAGDIGALRSRLDALATRISKSGALTQAGLNLISVVVVAAADDRLLKQVARSTPSIFLPGLKPTTWGVDLDTRHVRSSTRLSRPEGLRVLERALVGESHEHDLVHGEVLRQEHVARLARFQDLMQGRRPVATYGFIALNTAIFLAMFVGGTVDNGPGLVRDGALVPRLVLHGEPWRLFSAMFLHASVQHILFNMTSLFAIGTLAERLYGSLRFIAIYMGAGLIGAVASTGFAILNSNLDTPGVGASGAIFGVAGALITIRFQRSDIIPHSLRDRVSTTMIPLVTISLVFAYLTPYVDNAAHIGGLLGGMVLSFLFPLTKSVVAAKA